jgi:hypothetical protein
LPSDWFDDVRTAYIRAVLRLPMIERAREMKRLADALTVAEAERDEP